MTPSLDRAEVALRFAVALATPGDSNVPYSEWNHGEIVRVGFMFADAFAEESARRSFTALTPPVAPKSEAAKYVPKVGDVVRFVVYGATNGDGVVVAIQREGVASIRLFGESVHALTWGRYFKDLAYLRPATPAERAAAGLPSPEATRPTPWEPKPGDVFRFSYHSDDTYRVVRFDKGYIEAFEGVTGIGKGVLYEGDEHMVAAVVPVFVSPPPAPVEPAKGEAGRAEEYWRTHREGGGTDTDLRRFVQGWVARAATGGS
jgi:hypothetical protein